ncbi:MAG TPA: hypothetical protein VFD59_14605 [Nocardioidaceae bacterium]|nr:hypothetical protein [Nocardioidaceae bacterium]
MDLDQIKARRLLALTTFDTTGCAVTRPLWFAVDGERIVVISLEGREGDHLALDTDVEFGVIDQPGEIAAETWPGIARQLSGEAARAASHLMDTKYGFRRRIFRFFYWFTRSRPRRESYLEIRPVPTR